MWLVASTRRGSLLSFQNHPFRRAGDGGHGKGGNRHGPNGSDLEVEVPLGTVVRSLDGGVLVDLSGPAERWRAAEGGRGGHGNARFLTNRRRAPGFAEQGEKGEERWYDLELKLMADVALVGFPNAGKSTLVARISAARPKIADYPFTTLQPHLGVVRVGRAGDDTEFVVADVPGLVEGAAEGRGLGQRFLRHVERARILLVLVDLASPDGRPIDAQERVLLDELRRYRPELLERPRMVVGTKVDVAGRAPRHPGAGQIAQGSGDGGSRAAAGMEMAGPALCISAVTGEGVTELLGRLAQLVIEARAGEELTGTGGEVTLHRPLSEGIEVKKVSAGVFAIEGRSVARAVALSDLTDADAAEEVRDRLYRLGVDRALVRAGVRDGDTVLVGSVELTYQSDDVLVGAPQRPRRPRRSER